MYQQAPSLTRQVVYQIILFSISLAVLYPVLWVIKIALTPSQAFSMDPWPFPSAVSFENFESVIGTTNSSGVWLFGRQLFNSLIVSVLTAAVGVVLSCTAGYAMSRFAFPGRDAGMSFFLVTQMFPGVVMAIPLYILMEKLNLLNSISGLALAYAATAVPFCTWNLKGYFDTIPKDLEEAARMDGASQWVIFTQIVLPLSKPALAPGKCSPQVSDLFFCCSVKLLRADWRQQVQVSDQSISKNEAN